MAYRFAILSEVTPVGDNIPVGVVLERDDHVFVDTPDNMGIPRRYDEPFIVGSAQGPVSVRYTPSDPQYFDQVLIELSRSFDIDSRGEVPVSGDPTAHRLVWENVLVPLRAQKRLPYVLTSEHGTRYASVKTYRKNYAARCATRPASAHTDPDATPTTSTLAV
jgi:hypothetical protein